MYENYENNNSGNNNNGNNNNGGGKFCGRCGRQLSNGEKFCPGCGYAVGEQYFGQTGQNGRNTYQNPYQNQYQNPYQNQYGRNGYYSDPYYGAEREKTFNVLWLVLSIINTILISRLFGAIAIIFVIMAKNADTEEEAVSKLRVAKIINIISFVLLVLSIGFFISLWGIIIGIIGSSVGSIATALLI